MRADAPDAKAADERWQEIGRGLAEILRAFLPDYLRLVEPDAASHLDFATLSLLDAKLLNADGEAPGLAAAVATREGGRAVVVVRIELEAPVSRRSIAQQLRGTLEALDVRVGQPVLLSLVFLRGGRPGANLDAAPVAGIGPNETLRLFYTSFAVEKARAEYYLERTEPLAWALSALMHRYRTRRAVHRRSCLRRIRAADLEEPRRRLLLDWVELCLPAAPPR